MDEFPGIETVEDILKEIKITENDEWRNLNQKEINKLINLKKKNGDNMIIVSDRTFLFDLIGLINQLGFNETITYLKSNNYSDSIEIIKKSPPFIRARRRKFLELTKDLRINNIVVGIYTCPKCKSKQVQTIQKQTRSSDEPMTEYNTCQNCGFKWRNG